MELERRARGAAELARRALEPPEPFPDGPPDALACGLYHQSIVWALEAWATRAELSGAASDPTEPVREDGAAEASDAQTGDEDTGKPAEAADAESEETASEEQDAESEETASEAQDAESEETASEAPDAESKTVSEAPDAESKETASEEAASKSASAAPGLETLWATAKPERLFQESNVSPDEADEVKAFLAKRSFPDYADLPSDDQVRWARKLRLVSEGLLYGLEIVSGRYSPPWLTRVLRVGLVLALLIGLGWGAVLMRGWLVELDNLARGKSWVISSTYPAGCRSPAQTCIESPNFFFHTQEENQPWIEIDLGSVQSFSSVKVTNRTDCCAERAMPLVLEVSSDGQKWQLVAQKNEVFNVWNPDFDSVEGRWVRVRIPKRGILHLASIDIYK